MPFPDFSVRSQLQPEFPRQNTEQKRDTHSLFIREVKIGQTDPLPRFLPHLRIDDVRLVRRFRGNHQKRSALSVETPIKRAFKRGRCQYLARVDRHAFQCVNPATS